MSFLDADNIVEPLATAPEREDPYENLPDAITWDAEARRWKVNYTSVSALQMFDPNSYGGCNRAYWFKYKKGLRQPETAAMKRGTTQLHSPIETYYKTGVEAFTPLVLQGKRWLYKPDPAIGVEQEIGNPPGVVGPVDLALSPLRVAGIPLIGRMDLTQRMGVFLDEHAQLVVEPYPAFTREINDWKSAGGWSYTKSAAELRQTIQMLGYGRYAFLTEPDLDWVRLSHTVFITGKTTPDEAKAGKTTFLMAREENARRWEYVEGLGRQLHDVAQATDPDQVAGNKKSCNAFGRKGCYYGPKQLNVCSVGKFTSTASLFGEQGALALKNGTTPETTLEEIDIMGILSSNKTVTEAKTETHVGVTIAPAAEMAANSLDMLDELEAEDKATPSSTLAPEVVQAFDIIAQHAPDMGTPRMIGDATDLYSEYTAQKTGTRLAYTPGAAIAGTGKLAGLYVHKTAADIIKLGGDLVARAAKKAAAASAPQSAPVTTPAPAAPKATGIVSEETPASDPKLASKAPEAPPKAEEKKPEPAPVKAEQPKAPEVKAEEKKPEPAAETKAAPKKEKTTPIKKAVDATEPFELYLNCIPSQPFEMLDRHVAEWNATLSKYFKLAVPDVRVGKGVPQLDFGAWPGTLATLVRECIADGKLPRARYVLFTRGDQLLQVVAQAMIEATQKTGETYDGPPVLDMYVQGIA